VGVVPERDRNDRPYCGVGCPLELTVQDNRIVKAGSPRSSSASAGHLCIKGGFGWDFVQDDPA